MTIVEQSGGQYHVLLIIADGQVISFEHLLEQESPKKMSMIMNYFITRPLFVASYYLTK